MSMAAADEDEATGLVQEEDWTHRSSARSSFQGELQMAHVKSVAREDASFRVKLEKMGRTYGIAYRVVSTSGGCMMLVVTALVNHSSVSAWNETCDINDVICVGDAILSVNGRIFAQEMVEELQCEDTAHLLVLRAGPRWHLLGISSACIARIEQAMGRGLSVVTFAGSKGKGRRTLNNSIGLAQFGVVVFCAAVPCLWTLLLFSNIGYGLVVYSYFSDWSWNVYANLILLFVTLFFLAGIVDGLLTWRKQHQRNIILAFVLSALAAAFLMKCRFYPFSPVIICLLLMPVTLGFIRDTALRAVKRSTIYWATWLATAVVGILVLLLWIIWNNVIGNNQMEKMDDMASRFKTAYDNSRVHINGTEFPLDYVLHCANVSRVFFEKRGVRDVIVPTNHRLTADENSAIDQQCGELKTILFILWISPFMCSMSCLAVSAICWASSTLRMLDSSSVEKVLRNNFLIICIMLMSIWLSITMAGASMRLAGTALAFIGAAMLLMTLWIYMDLRKLMLTPSLRESLLLRGLIVVSSSDWVRAGIVLVFNVTLPAMLAMLVLNQSLKRLRAQTTSVSLLPGGALKLWKIMEAWTWGKVFINVNRLVMIFVVLDVGVAKFLTVLFSSLIDVMLGMHFAAALALFFVVGFLLLLLPVVPGLAVGYACGVAVHSCARNTVLGGGWGTLVAVALSMVLKLAGVWVQFYIGKCLGRSIKVQQIVGVDRPFTRSLECLLRPDGLSMPKVTIFVGTPDWAVNTLCGVLDLNLGQCLLGNLPFMVILTPCVVAGAFTDEDSESLWTALAYTLLAFAILGQLAAITLAFFFVQATLREHYMELSEPRLQDEAIVDLTRAEEEEALAWCDMLRWQSLPETDRHVIISSVVLMNISFFMFVFMDEACFRPFQVSHRVAESYGHGGLNGSVLNIVLGTGWLALACFCGACVLHVVFVHLTVKRMTRYLSKKAQLQASLRAGFEGRFAGVTKLPAAQQRQLQLQQRELEVRNQELESRMDELKQQNEQLQQQLQMLSTGAAASRAASAPPAVMQLVQE